MRANNQIVTVAQMQAAEQALIAGGESISSLMERAGAGAATWVWRMAAGRSVTVLCGPGNNGGDGYVIARVLEQRGLKVAVIAPLEPRTDAAKAARAAWGGQVVPDARAENRGGVFVDCLLGSGLSRGLDAPLERLLGQLVAAHDYAVAVDLPSGVDADSGALLNDNGLRFDLTIALGAWKFAHWLMPAMAEMGHRRLVDIGVAAVPGAAVLARSPRLSAPDMAAHKYTRGLLAVIGGAMPGASIMAARAAMHGGAGYVKLFAAGDPGPVPAELVVEQDEGIDRRLSALLIGPGLGRDEAARGRLAATLAHDLPTVCDADALHLLAPAMLEGRKAPLILTPHGGELEALGNSFGTVGLDRIEAVQELAEAVRGVVVAKGPDTLLAAPGLPITIMPGASTWLSTAGTGDVLAGLIVSRLAAGRSCAFAAALEGCHLHAEAARMAGPAFSAADLIHYIPAAWNKFL